VGLTEEQRYIVESVVSCYETGSALPGYDVVVVLKDGAGITYGKHQATDGGESSLDAIVQRYSDLGGRLAAQLMEYMPQLEADATTTLDPDNLPSWCLELMDLLAEAGRTDPIMADAQDQIFDERYWQPAASQALAMQLVEPLSWLAVYDTTIQSGQNGVANIRKLFSEVPPSQGGDEKAWTNAFTRSRGEWLRRSSTQAVVGSAFRTDDQIDQMDAGRWALEPEVEVRIRNWSTVKDATEYVPWTGNGKIVMVSGPPSDSVA
jgi:hypothetical protein